MLEKRPILVREKNLSIPQGQLKIKINLEGSTILVEKEKILPSKRAQNSWTEKYPRGSIICKGNKKIFQGPSRTYKNQNTNLKINLEERLIIC